MVNQITMGHSLKEVRCLISIVTFVLVNLVNVPAHSATEFTVQLRWYHQFQFAGYYMALEKGYYDEAGLDVTLLQGSSDTLKPLDLVLEGKVDFAISNSGVVIERMKGKPVVALAAIMQTSPMVWIVLEESNIYTPLDLSGKRLMLMPPPESAELLAMLLQEGINPDQLELIPTTLDINDLVRGDVDAYDGYISNEPYYLTKQGIDYRLLEPRNYGVNFYNDVLITREDLVQRKPREVEDFVSASLRGWEYALNNIEETVDIIRDRYTVEKSRDHLLFEAYELKALIMPELVELGHMNPARWQNIASSYISLGFAVGPVKLEGFLFEPVTVKDLTWLYRVIGFTVVVLIAISFVAMRFARLNRKLRNEAAARMSVEEQLRKKQQQLFYMANSDQLTGVWNRFKLERVGNDEILRSRRYRYPLSLLFLDLDDFKEINDEHGHHVGDKLLKSVAKLLGENLRQSDRLFRWGGEEFLILAPHTGPEQARELAEKLRKIIASTQFPYECSVTVSIGVATLCGEEDLEGLIRRADKALYHAKEQGRNRIVCHEADIAST